MSFLYSYLSAPFNRCKRTAEVTPTIAYEQKSVMDNVGTFSTFVLSVEHIYVTMEKYDEDTQRSVVSYPHIELLDELTKIVQDICNRLDEEVTLYDVLNRLTHEDKSHLKRMIVVYRNANNELVEVPYSFSHLHDSFPCDDIFCLLMAKESEQAKCVRLVYEETNDEGEVEMKDKDITNTLRYMTHNDMMGGFNNFRPHAWSFLTDLTEDPYALLRVDYEHETKYIRLHDMTNKGLIKLSVNNGPQ